MRDTTLSIRDAHEGDRDAATEITLAAYAEYEALMPPFAWTQYRDDMVHSLSGEGPPTERIVAERDGPIVGSVLLIPAGTTFTLPDGSEFTMQAPEVRLLAVPPSERGKGIGRALMAECIRRARQAGSPTINLHTTDMMQTAMQMYERMGFLRTPELDFHPAPGIVIEGYCMDLSAS